MNIAKESVTVRGGGVERVGYLMICGDFSCLGRLIF